MILDVGTTLEIAVCVHPIDKPEDIVLGDQSSRRKVGDPLDCCDAPRMPSVCVARLLQDLCFRRPSKLEWI